MKKTIAYRGAVALLMGAAIPLKMLVLRGAGSAGFPLAAVMGGAQALGLFAASQGRRPRPALAFLGCVLLCSWAAIAYLALSVDVDFFKLLFHAFFFAYLVALMRSDLFLADNRRRRMRAVQLTRMFMIAIVAWIFLVSCILIIGKSARAADSICFNLYNTIFVALGYLETLRLRSSKSLVIGDGSIAFEDFRLENFFGEGDRELLSLFLERAGEALNCSAIAERLPIGDGPGADRCDECRSRDYKATSCTYYRSLYNRVLAIKKFLEAFELGTIKGPSAKPAVKRDGWRLELKSNVRLVDRRSREAG